MKNGLQLLLPKKPFVVCAPPSVCGFSHFPVSGFFVYPLFVIGWSGVESATAFPDPVLGAFCGADTSGVEEQIKTNNLKRIS